MLVNLHLGIRFEIAFFLICLSTESGLAWKHGILANQLAKKEFDGEAPISTVARNLGMVDTYRMTQSTPFVMTE